MLVALAFATGIVDTVNYLGLGRVLTANMTSNIVLLGFALASKGGIPIVGSLVLLVAFLAGAVVSGCLSRRLEALGHR